MKYRIRILWGVLLLGTAGAAWAYLPDEPKAVPKAAPKPAPRLQEQAAPVVARRAQ